MPRLLASILFGFVLVACDAGPPVRACPSLVIDGWTWFGVIGPPGSASPGEWVRLYYPGNEEYGDEWYATPTGSFALRAAGRVRRDQPNAVLELVRSGARYSVRPGNSEALIEYEAGSRPVVQSGPGEMTFTGWLGSEHSSTPIAAAWVVDWMTGEVEWIDPQPALSSPFTVSMPGGLHHCLTIYTEHVDEGTGGCWWPQGGGCLCHRCTIAEEQAGTCHESDDDWQQSPYGPHLPCGCNETPPADPSHPGREPLPVDERHDPPPPTPSPGPSHGPPPPDRVDGVPVGEPADAGSPERPDAWHERFDSGPPM